MASVPAAFVSRASNSSGMPPSRFLRGEKHVGGSAAAQRHPDHREHCLRTVAPLSMFRNVECGGGPTITSPSDGASRLGAPPSRSALTSLLVVPHELRPTSPPLLHSIA
jgi:hypothetical protein